jgi:monooxygenase
MAQEHFDVLIIGAGLSGIDAAYHLQKFCPNKSYVILEQRARIGGTWDLFRYPGIRSDSDMLTMGYSFRPWTSPKTISPGEDIRDYITATAQESGGDRHIRFRHTIQRAAWSSQSAAWQVTAQHQLPNEEKETITLSCNFLFSCAGYYRYAAGHLPEFPNIHNFNGRVIHPQFWPEDLDVAGKRVVIIGSGATAVTLLPALAKYAAHVTMLQRSPGYVVSLPEQDPVARWLRGKIPASWAYRLCRWKNILWGFYFYQLAQRFPNFAKAGIIKNMVRSVGPNCAVPTPRYKPWQQRLCLVPDGDMFKAIRSGRASVVTSHVRTFTGNGVQLDTGQTLEADIIIAATGLELQYLGGIEVSVDGCRIDFSQTLSYKGVMNSGVPNLASVFGYINASWTLKADLICRYVCRLLNFMDEKGMRQVTPRNHGVAKAGPFVENFSSSYVQRALHHWPKQGKKTPWRVYQNYFFDIFSLRWAPLQNRALEFSNPTSSAASGDVPQDFTKSAVGS